MKESLPPIAQLSLKQPLYPPLEFHPFPRLPAELRLKIWSFAHPGPRDIQITCQKIRLSPRQTKLHAESFKSNLPPPPTCHACPESRAEALEIYKPFFHTTRSECQTYISFEKDTIIMADKDISYLGTEEKQGIRRMRIGVVDCENFGRYHIETIKSMENLVELEINMDEKVVRESGSLFGRDVVSHLQWELGKEMRDDLAWNCPKIRIVGSDTGEVLGTMRGGAWIPGWKEGDDGPADDTIEAYWAYQGGLTDSWM